MTLNNGDGTFREVGAQTGIHLEGLIGKPGTFLEVIEELSKGTLQAAPTFLLAHMPKAYAIWMWNDYDANRQT